MENAKIIKIEPFLLSSKLSEPFYFSQFEYRERKICIVKITLDNGITGWGEGYGPGLLVKAGIEQLTPLVLGRDPLQTENIWQDMFRMAYDYARKGVYLSSLSAIDIALWDIKGKILQQPVSILLGGRKRETVKAYATGLYFTHGGDMTEKLREEALSYKNQGFEALKMKVGLGLETDIRNVTAIRKAIGDKMGLMIDANHAFSLMEARQLTDSLQDLNIGWFEEPLVNEDYDGYAELRKSGKIPIAGGECEYLKYGALEMLSKKCVDIFQPDTCACGGITEMKKIMGIAQAFNINLTPHNWGTGIAIAANLHIVSNLDAVPQRLFPQEPLLEFDCSENGLRDELLVENFKAVNGRLTVPSGHGLGIQVNEDKLNDFLHKP
jgi:D-galactarolactone cycloisomerase